MMLRDRWRRMGGGGGGAATSGDGMSGGRGRSCSSLSAPRRSRDAVLRWLIEDERVRPPSSMRGACPCGT
jgi:hypothetical protein